MQPARVYADTTFGDAQQASHEITHVSLIQVMLTSPRGAFPRCRVFLRSRDADPGVSFVVGNFRVHVHAFSLFSNQQTSFVTCFATTGDVLRVLAPAGTHVFDMFNVCGPPQSVFSRFRAPPRVRFVAPLQRFPGLRFLVFEVVGHRNCIESHMLRALLP